MLNHHEIIPSLLNDSELGKSVDYTDRYLFDSLWGFLRACERDYSYSEDCIRQNSYINHASYLCHTEIDCLINKIILLIMSEC